MYLICFYGGGAAPSVPILVSLVLCVTKVDLFLLYFNYIMDFSPLDSDKKLVVHTIFKQ